jgi:glycosyltransferase involved in cell wall biosynthesis
MSLDDLITQLPPKNSFYRFAFKDAKPRLRRAAALCQRLIVSTEPLRELTRGMCDDVQVLPNRLESSRWLGLRSTRRAGRKPRVGWAGAQQHQGDLELIRDVVRATAREVEWVFFGMCPEALRPYVYEFHEFVASFDEYPAKLASLNLDLAVAPLELNAFNEAKSNLRLLEYGILGWPVICTDIYPYQEAPVTRLPNEPRAWIEAIRERIHDLDAAAQEGDRLREWVLAGYLLEDHLEEWLAAFAHPASVCARPPAPAVP